MQLPIPFLAAIETAINAWLKLDDKALHRLSELEGKIIRIHVTAMELDLFFFPSSSGLQVQGNYPDAEDGGIVDATITGSPIDLIKLTTSSNAGATLLESGVNIDGDMHVAEKFSAILREVDIDWEQHLSNLFGNFMARNAAQAKQTFDEFLEESKRSFEKNTKEYLVDESELSPDKEEMDQFMQQVDTIRMDVDRIEARIKQLQQDSKTD